MKFFSTYLLMLTALCTLNAQGKYWQDFEEANILLPFNAEVDILASEYRTLSLEFSDLCAALSTAPMEFSEEASTNPVRISLPLPDGTMEEMEIVESPVMAPELVAKYPGIKAFLARSINNKLISARIDYSPYGFHASITTPEGHVTISPYATEQTRFYISYYTRNIQIDPSIRPPHSHGFDYRENEIDLHLQQQEQLSLQTELSFRNMETVPLREYRLALVCTGEYGDAKGGTVEAVLATYNTAINALNLIFQVEFATRMELIAESEDFIHLDPSTDPFVNSNEGIELLEQNKDYLNSQIAFDAYDVGHIFTMSCTDVGGVNSGNACTANKARCVTCHYLPNVTAIVNTVMTHELGHMLSSGHSWNNCPPSLDQLSIENAFEPGSGSTIMAYQGLCGAANDIPAPIGIYYNVGSLEDLIFFTREGGGSECGESIATDNNQPTISMPYEDGFYIPISTPFELDASAEDEDGDPLTYCWEQYDLGPSTNLGNPTLNSPLFRSYPPVVQSLRVFPRLDKIVANTSDNTEVLPTYSRDMTFRLTVRDNNPMYGGAVWDQVAFEADETAGPFVVTYPSATGVVMNVGDYNEITWDVANTTNVRVNCHNVNIKLSIDGGFTYPYTLVENTPNDGAAFVTIPDAVTTDARIRVEAANNIFFDISNQNFAIEPATAPTYSLDIRPASIPLYCLPADPLTFDVSTVALQDYAMPVSLSLAGDLPAGASATFASEELTPGENTTLTIDLGDFSGRDTFQLQLQGTTDDLGTFERELYFIAVSTDFLGMELQMPANGTEGVFLTTDFSWANISGADSYDFELATSPAFGSTIVESAEGLTESNYTPQVLLEDDELYYWRVRPYNACGAGEPTVPFAFHTATVDCAGSEPSDLPISLPSNPNTKTSTLFVAESGTISDINVEDININFNPVNSLRITLVSPEGTEVILYNLNCLNTSLINLSFDDEAPTDIQCPPASGNPMRPENPLSAFIGENTQGEWQLKVQVVNAGFGSGSINSWGVEFCSTASPTPPSLLTNETLQVPPGQGNPITNSHLEASDDNASDSQIKFILVTVPENGSLYRTSDNEPLVPGESFTQQTINSYNLSYVHDGSATTTDQFIFIVEDGAGGFIPNEVFNIEIDEDAMVNTDDLNADNAIELFPNPANKMAQLRLQQPLSEDGQIYLRNTQGQIVQSLTMKSGATALEINTSKQAAGIYLVEVHSGDNVLSQKLIIQH